jgi:peptidoglycan/xylan/chitin deacetylase (PgdA/CDA1 family)
MEMMNQPQAHQSKRKKRPLRGRRIRRRLRRLILFLLLAYGAWFGLNHISTEAQEVVIEIPLVYDFNNGSNQPEIRQTFSRFNGQERKFAYLTFDDGPSEYLADILDILEEYNVQATFFMIGNNFASPDTHEIIRRVIREGHYIGVHSMTHSYRRLYTQGYAVQEMIEARELLSGIIGFRPNLVRFPFGSGAGLTEYMKSQAYQAGLRMWDWTVDSEDWLNPDDPDEVLEIVIEQIHRNREIILFHEMEVTVRVLPAVIEYLLEQGYEIRAYREERHFVLNHFDDNRF